MSAMASGQSCASYRLGGERQRRDVVIGACDEDEARRRLLVRHPQRAKRGGDRTCRRGFGSGRGLGVGVPHRSWQGVLLLAPMSTSAECGSASHPSERT